MQELVPLERCVLESLHLIIQTGDTWIELVRNVLQYLVTAPGTARDLSAPSAHHTRWVLATSSSIQSAAFRAAGFDLDALIYQKLAINKPITKYHGAQIRKILQNREQLWKRACCGIRRVGGKQRRHGPAST